MKVGINGMGRIGRLALRAAMGAAERGGDDPRAGNRLEVVHLNEIKGGAAATAHLLTFDTVQGRWRADIAAEGDDAIRIGERRLRFTSHATSGDIPWGDLGVDVVLECTGKFLTPETLQGHLDRGAKRVIVAAPVKVGDVLNIVVGVNHHLYDPAKHRIVTAASCTTNCLAPVVKVIHEGIGIRHGSLTTIQAFLRTPQTLPQALAAMVAENEIRADITPWEKGRLIMNAVQEDIFPTPDAAVAGLYPHATPSTRSRLRTVAGVVHDLTGILTDPTVYSLRQLLRIAAALKADFAEVIAVALRECPDRSQPVQWDLLQNILSEAEHSLTEPQKPQAPGRPRRLLYPRANLIIRRERLPNGYRLTFTGPEARGMMMESVLDQIERMYGPG